MRSSSFPFRLTVAGCLLALGACTPSPPVARHTVAEYRASTALRHEQMAACTNDPGTLGQTPDCVNALQAARREDTRSLRELPPVQLPKTDKPYIQSKPGH